MLRLRESDFVASGQRTQTPERKKPEENRRLGTKGSNAHIILDFYKSIGNRAMQIIRQALERKADL